MNWILLYSQCYLSFKNWTKKAVQVSITASIAGANQQVATAAAQKLTNKIAAQEEIEINHQETVKKIFKKKKC